MIKVTLYENAIPDNNRNSISGCQNIEQQKAYFDSLNKIELNADRFTWKNPFIVQANQGSLWKYQYGSYEYEGKRYYFSVDEINPVNDTKSEIVYRIDWLETLKYELIFNNSYVFSSNKELPYPKRYYEQDVDYYNYTQLQSFKMIWQNNSFSISRGYGIILYQHESSDNDKTYIIFVSPKYIDGEQTRIFYRLDTLKTITEDLKSEGIINKLSDIYGAWIIPPEFISTTGQTKYLDKEKQEYYIYSLNDDDLISGQNAPSKMITLNDSVRQQLYSKPSKELVFCDNYGQVLWEQPYNTTIRNTHIAVNYNVNAAQCTIICQLFGEIIHLLEPSSFSFTYIPLSLDVITNTYEDYVYLQRQYDMDIRNLNMNKNLVKGIGGSIESAMFGGLMGGQFGRDLGVKKGQAVGGAGSLISTLTDYQTEQYFSPIEQEIIDKYYVRQNDSITQGSASSLYAFDGKQQGFYLREYNQTQVNDFNTLFNFYGYKYNQLVNKQEMQEVYNKSITENQFSHLKQDVTFIKNYNDEIRKQIHQRLYNGVTFNTLTTGDNNE